EPALAVVGYEVHRVRVARARLEGKVHEGEALAIGEDDETAAKREAAAGESGTIVAGCLVTQPGVVASDEVGEIAATLAEHFDRLGDLHDDVRQQFLIPSERRDAAPERQRALRARRDGGVRPVGRRSLRRDGAQAQPHDRTRY